MAETDEAKLARMKQAFNLFDTTGEGYISKDALKNVFKTLGREDSGGDSDVTGLFTDRGGKIDFETFMDLYNGKIKGEQEVLDLQEAFRLLDKNGNGYIGALELQFLCKKWGEDLTLEEVDKMVSEALIGYDGKIFYDGLLKILITQ